MRKYQFPVEVHNHTIHSDGDFTVQELVEAAVDFGYAGMILTDHNSSAGYSEMDGVSAVQKGEIITLPGIEWTTYFGHMLVHDADYDVDWREATPDSIDVHMQEVQQANGLVGIAHPYDMGSPICTGCHWDYQVQDYNLVNYIEIWNSNQPQEKSESILAYEMWLDKLNKGYEISCSAGRDWHRPDNSAANFGVTYLELREEALTQENFKEALRQGSYYVTLGPTAEFTIQQEANAYYMGDRVGAADLKGGEVQLHVQPTELAWLQAFEVSNAYIQVWNNEHLLHQSEVHADLEQGLTSTFELDEALNAGFLRFVVRGDYRGTKDTPIVVGNPVYLK